MRRTVLRIGAELLPLLLVFACLGAALGLIVQAHKRPHSPKIAKTREPVPVAPLPSPAAPPPVVVVPPAPTPEPEPADPTEAALAEIRSHLDEQSAAAKKADADAERLAAARKALAERTEGWKRRQMLAKEQLDRVDTAVSTLEKQADVLARMRDVLAAKRDKEKVELAAAKTRSGVAVLPYKGVNGTWRLPIVVECRNGMATMQPNGPSFSLVELSGVFSTRTSPIARAVAMRLMELRGIESPDGSAVVPYLLFVIRPDGIRPYYEARSRLEPLGITFGYELVDSDTDIDFPDLADVSEWSEVPGKRKPRPAEGEYVWPADRPDFAGKGPDSEFVWPTTETATAGDFQGTNRPGRSPFDPLSKPEIEPYDNSKASLDSLFGSGGHPAMPGDFGQGGLLSGDDMRKPLKPGRVELTPDDLLAAVEEASRGPSFDAYGREIHDPDPLAEPPAPAPFPSGVVPGSRPGFESPTTVGGPQATGYPRSPSRVMPGRPQGGFGDDRFEGTGRRSNQNGTGRRSQGAERVERPVGGSGPSRVASGSRPVGENSQSPNRVFDPGTIGSYGAAFTPTEATPETSGAGGPLDSSGLSNSEEPSRESSSPAGTNSGAATSGGSGGEHGKGTRGAASPGLVNMSFSGEAETSESIDQKQGQLQGKGGDSSEAAGNGNGSGAAMSSEAYRKRRNLDMVIACGPSGLVVHPGGYRISRASLDADEHMLDKVLHGIVRNHEKKDSKSEWMPRLKYLVEPGGQTTYTKARKQNVTGASGWPAHLQVTEGSPLHIAVEEKRTR